MNYKLASGESTSSSPPCPQACWVAVGGSTLALLLLTLLVEEPPRKAQTNTTAEVSQAAKRRRNSTAVTAIDLAEFQGKATKGKEAADKTSPEHKRILNWVVLGLMMDAAGDEGTRIARGTIMQNLYPETSDVDLQNKLLLLTVGTLFLTLLMLGKLQKKHGFGACLVVGSVFTLLSQVCFLLDFPDWYTFLIPFYTGKTFGFLSTMSGGMIVNKLADPDARGIWMGKKGACQGLGQSIAPIVMSVMYDAFVETDPKGTRCLAISIAISFMACLVYLPQLKWLPKEPTLIKELYGGRDKDELRELPDPEYSRLPLELQEEFLTQALRDKEPQKVRTLSWGKFEDDINELAGINERATDGFIYLRDKAKRALASHKLMDEEYDSYMLRKEFMKVSDQTKAKEEMMNWVADYFEDAGYDMWKTDPVTVKAMLMSCFPPIDPLGDQISNVDGSRAGFERYLLKYVRVMHEHVKIKKSEGHVFDEFLPP